ncbi:hypothetical protein [Dictyobacter formicarum]|uniref:Tyr recombinase domain-containing protein n=1 Tax=Dictyobacter formicarum TaxID=2778368 RepID=A0ABQ3VD49_9CHLR|nr:hypothetical protein [Dictyobacter formicarum]GHO84087.1 hypothetical protein KSZ_20930 [Dictyobacter formicarum]
MRDTFAVRYLQAGGEPETLRKLLGLKDMVAVKHYQRLSAQMVEKEKQKEPAAYPLLRQTLAPDVSRRSRRRPSMVATEK